MMSPLELMFSPEESAYQVAAVQKKQKAVTRYYDDNPSSTDVDVYQPEWSERLLQWYRAYSRAKYSTKVSDVISNSMLKDVEWGVFFSEEPVAAVALWKLLQASYELDAIVFRISQEETLSLEATQAMQKWQNMKPFEYLSNGGVEKRWRAAVKGLHSQFEIKTSEDEDEILRRMREVRCGVDALETAWKELQISWVVNLKDFRSKDLMLAQIREAITWRFSALSNAMRDGSADTRTNGRKRTAGSNSERSRRNFDDVQSRMLQRRQSWPVRVLLHSENRGELLLLLLMVMFAYLSLEMGKGSGNHSLRTVRRCS